MSSESPISVRGSDPNSSHRVFTWPALEAGNGSYPDGVYWVDCKDQERGKSLRLVHRVQGARLIEQWMDSGKVSFVCSVAAPRSMYRKLHLSNKPEQVVEWTRDDLGEYPMFTPMIIAGENIDHVANSETDGLSPMWHDKELCLPKGARLAVGPTFRLQSGINGMLDFNLDEQLEDGRYRVEESTDDGFKFKVYLATDLHQHLRLHRGDLAGANIMTGIVAAALGILQRSYDKDETDGDEISWRNFRNLVGLADLLDERNLNHWSDENFKPELVATGLYPHKLPKEDN